MFKGLMNFASMLKNASQLGGRMQEINQRLRNQRATGSAGAGLVQVEVNGLGEVLKLSIDPTLIERGEREMIEDLVPAAVNQAQAKAKQMHAEAMQSMASDMNIPGMDEAMAEMTKNNPGGT